jgi:membrane associated rhomboid family serine protease
MREPAEISAAIPRPGRVLKILLITLAITAVLGAVITHWMPGGDLGDQILGWVRFEPKPVTHLLWKPWTFVTSGILTYPVGISHTAFSLFGLYIFGQDLEKRWGGARFLRFLALGMLFGNLFVLLADQLPFTTSVLDMRGRPVEIFHPAAVVGAGGAITACAMAWSMSHTNTQIRLFFVLPVSGRTLYWITIGFVLLSPIFIQTPPEGIAAPFGGLAAGLLFGGTPSRARTAWLRLKLAFIRRNGGGHGLTVESITGGPDRPRPKRKGGPPLRVVQGGLDDDLKDRKPPKDKRYLN